MEGAAGRLPLFISAAVCFLDHAADQMIRRDIQAFEIEEALLGPSEVIERYPDAAVTAIVTVYEPDPTQLLWGGRLPQRRVRSSKS